MAKMPKITQSGKQQVLTKGMKRFLKCKKTRKNNSVPFRKIALFAKPDLDVSKFYTIAPSRYITISPQPQGIGANYCRELKAKHLFI
ncbi:hypothetical protein D3C74_112720 [compost metagenome]